MRSAGELIAVNGRGSGLARLSFTRGLKGVFFRGETLSNGENIHMSFQFLQVCLLLLQLLSQLELVQSDSISQF